jgi:hypothetical protein
VHTVVEYLTSSACLPRTPGSVGGREACRFLEGQLAAIGLEPAGENGYRQPIPAIGGANLLARIDGAGTRADRLVMLEAHYDACDPFGEGMPGADDNAAAVAVVLEAARGLAERAASLDRSVAIALFDAEEPPYFLSRSMGSQWFVDHPTVALDAIDMMICLDLVGRAVGSPELPAEVRNSVFVLGAEKSRGTGALFDSLDPIPGIVPRRVGNHIVPAMSDYDAFMRARVPFLFYTNGRSRDYHAITDTPEKLDHGRMDALAEHLVGLVLALSVRPESRVAYQHRGQDDPTTLASLRAVLVPLVPLHPLAGEALEAVDGLAAIAQERRLRRAERRLIADIALGLEEALA